MRTTVSLALSFSLALAAAANAQQVKYNGSLRGQSVSVVTPFAPGGATYFTGEMGLSLLGAPADYPTNFVGFCVDLQHGVSTGDIYPVDLVPLPDAGLANSGRVAWLYENIGPAVSDNDTAAALQLAMWDVITDNGDGLGAGGFTSGIGGNVLTSFNSYIAASANQIGSATWLRSPTHPEGRRQDFIGPKPAIPEPGTAALVAMGALPLVSFLRRRR